MVCTPMFHQLQMHANGMFTR